jgi:hypothetical protein
MSANEESSRQTLSFLTSAFPRIIAPHLPALLTYATSNLQGYSPQFLQYYVSSDPDAPEPPSPTSDVGFGAQQNTIEDLACAIFDFLTPAVRQKSVETLLGGGSEAEQWARGVVELVLLYTRVTRTNVSQLNVSVTKLTGRKRSGWKMRTTSSRMTMTKRRCTACV